MTDEKFVISNLRRDGRSSSHQQNRDDLVIKNYQGDFEKMKNFVGPAFIICKILFFILLAGVYGLFFGIFKSAREITFRNRPKKLLLTSVINMIGKHSSRCANAGASITLLYCLLKKSINFVFEEELAAMTITQKQMFYGFITGAVYKSTRGLAPAVLCGALTAVGCATLQVVYDKIYKTKKNKV